MAIIRKKELNNMAPAALSAKLLEVRRELNTERGLIKSGGRSSNPGKIKELRRTIARILTKLTQKASLLPGKKMGAKAASAGTKSTGASAKTASASKPNHATAPNKTTGPAPKKTNEVKISA